MRNLGTSVRDFLSEQAQEGCFLKRGKERRTRGRDYLLGCIRSLSLRGLSAKKVRSPTHHADRVYKALLSPVYIHLSAHTYTRLLPLESSVADWLIPYYSTDFLPRPHSSASGQPASFRRLATSCPSHGCADLRTGLFRHASPLYTFLGRQGGASLLRVWRSRTTEGEEASSPSAGMKEDPCRRVKHGTRVQREKEYSTLLSDLSPGSLFFCFFLGGCVQCCYLFQNFRELLAVG